MLKKSKLQTWYFMIIFTLIILITIMYVIMSKIENTTTMLENHIRKRNLSYTVDKDYSLQKVQTKDETITFLNNLTEFFTNFHDQTVNYKKELEEFMERRKEILDRFNQSSIQIYDMSIVPDVEDTTFTVKGREKYPQVVEKINRNFD